MGNCFVVRMESTRDARHIAICRVAKVTSSEKTGGGGRRTIVRPGLLGVLSDSVCGFDRNAYTCVRT